MQELNPDVKALITERLPTSQINEIVKTFAGNSQGVGNSFDHKNATIQLLIDLYSLVTPQ